MNQQQTMKPPVAFAIAVLAAGSIMPFALLMDALRAPGGDGLQGFWEMVLFLIVVLVLTIGGIILGFRRKERFNWLAWLALVLLVAPLWVMMV